MFLSIDMNTNDVIKVLQLKKGLKLVQELDLEVEVMPKPGQIFKLINNHIISIVIVEVGSRQCILNI